MSTMTGHSPSLPRGGALDVQFIARMGQRAFTAIRAWWTSMRQRRELLMLNDIELCELSLTAADVNREVSRPFWESIHLTSH
jgi:uncharacterized protein YjiS (DUF1127 family)